MRSTPLPHTPNITLHRHVIAVLPCHVVRALAGLALATTGIVQHKVSLLIAGVLVGGMLVGLSLLAWRIYTVTIRYDRIRVRHLWRGRIQEDLYPFPGMCGLTRRQSILGG